MKTFFLLRKRYKYTKFRLSRIFYLWLYKKSIRKYGCEIPLNIELSETTVFPHQLYGIFISGWAKVGENCTIFQQVTIGSNTLVDAKKKGAPIIGDNAYIGAGAKIIGNVYIGKNARIGANCIVVDDVPDNATVVLEKPRVMIRTMVTESNNKFVSIDNINN